MCFGFQPSHVPAVNMVAAQVRAAAARVTRAPPGTRPQLLCPELRSPTPEGRPRAVPALLGGDSSSASASPLPLQEAARFSPAGKGERHRETRCRAPSTPLPSERGNRAPSVGPAASSTCVGAWLGGGDPRGHCWVGRPRAGTRREGSPGLTSLSWRPGAGGIPASPVFPGEALPRRAGLRLGAGPPGGSSTLLSRCACRPRAPRNCRPPWAQTDCGEVATSPPLALGGPLRSASPGCTLLLSAQGHRGTGLQVLPSP